MTPLDPIPPTTTLLAIDPGINGTGWALWRGNAKRPTAPDEVGVLRKRFESFDLASFWLTSELKKILRERRLICPVHLTRTCGCVRDTSCIVVCEFPEFQTGAARSMGWMKGDLQKLTFLVGAIGQMAHDAGCQFEPVPVSHWKGQLPKDIVTDRIIRLIGGIKCSQLGIKTHAWDATGIGLWRRGLFT